MKLVTITIKAAFLDAPNVTADGIADSLIRDLSDGLYAEVAFTTERTEQVLEHPDPDPEADNYDEWQETARAALDETGADVAAERETPIPLTLLPEGTLVKYGFSGHITTGIICRPPHLASAVVYTAGGYAGFNEANNFWSVVAPPDKALQALYVSDEREYRKQYAR